MKTTLQKTKPIKILLCGSASSGKTTLQEALACDPFFKDFIFKQEIVRWNSKIHKLALNKKSDTKSQKFYNKIYKNGFFQYINDDNIIFDRGAICAVVYADEPTVDPRVRAETIKLAKLQLEAVDLIIVTAPILSKIEYAGDGVREMSKEYQDKAHETYLKLLADWGYMHKTLVLAGSTSYRIKKIKSFLKKIK